MAGAIRRNERAVRSLLEEVLNGQQYDRIPSYCAPAVTMHRPGGIEIDGLEGYEDHYRGLHAAFPDLVATLTDIVADDDRVAIRISVAATHEGALLGIEPTGRRVQFPAQVLFRLEEGRITEEFHQSDRVRLREQLGGHADG